MARTFTLLQELNLLEDIPSESWIGSGGSISSIAISKDESLIYILVLKQISGTSLYQGQIVTLEYSMEGGVYIYKNSVEITSLFPEWFLKPSVTNCISTNSSGTILAIGMGYNDYPGSYSGGSVAVLNKLDATTWSLDGDIIRPGEYPLMKSYGTTVQLDQQGTKLLVRYKDVSGGYDTWKVDIWERFGGIWVRVKPGIISYGPSYGTGDFNSLCAFGENENIIWVANPIDPNSGYPEYNTSGKVSRFYGNLDTSFSLAGSFLGSDILIGNTRAILGSQGIILSSDGSELLMSYNSSDGSSAILGYFEYQDGSLVKIEDIFTSTTRAVNGEDLLIGSSTDTEGKIVYFESVSELLRIYQTNNSVPETPDRTPVLMLRWRNNNQGQWSAPRMINLGKRGDTKLVESVRKLGQYFTRQYELTWTDEVPVIIAAFDEYVKPGGKSGG